MTTRKKKRRVGARRATARVLALEASGAVAVGAALAALQSFLQGGPIDVGALAAAQPRAPKKLRKIRVTYREVKS